MARENDRKWPVPEGDERPLGDAGGQDGPAGTSGARPGMAGGGPGEAAGQGQNHPAAARPPAAPLPPAGPSPDGQRALARLEAMIDGLLHPIAGCPWDRRQTTRTITEDLLEEAYELRQALNEDRPAEILEEAGDVAFLLSFLGRLTEKAFGFGLREFLDAATDKMVARHPHVFGDDQPIEDMDSFWKKWHKIKRESKPGGGVLDSVPVDLPALTRCHRLAQKAGRSGFDFPSVPEIRRVLDSELRELDAELERGRTEDEAGRERQAHEIGDVLASVANLARHLGLSAEKCLDAYNRRFIARFRHMEAALAGDGQRPEEAGAGRLEELWAEAKAALGQGKG